MAPLVCYGQNGGLLGFAAQKQVFFRGYRSRHGGMAPRRWPRRAFRGPPPTSGTGLSLEEVVECDAGLGWSISLHRQVPGSVLGLNWKPFPLLVCDWRPWSSRRQPHHPPRGAPSPETNEHCARRLARSLYLSSAKYTLSQSSLLTPFTKIVQINVFTTLSKSSISFSLPKSKWFNRR